MNVLIVFAHPEPASFSAALKNEAVATLTRAGHAVAVSDLYAMGWNPALGPQEFAHDRTYASFLDLSREQEHAHRNASHAADVRAEQAKVAAADLVHAWDDYDESQRLKPGVVARSGVQWNPARSPPDGGA